MSLVSLGWTNWENKLLLHRRHVKEKCIKEAIAWYFIRIWRAKMSIYWRLVIFAPFDV